MQTITWNLIKDENIVDNGEVKCTSLFSVSEHIMQIRQHINEEHNLIFFANGWDPINITNTTREYINIKNEYEIHLTVTESQQPKKINIEN